MCSCGPAHLQPLCGRPFRDGSSHMQERPECTANEYSLHVCGAAACTCGKPGQHVLQVHWHQQLYKPVAMMLTIPHNSCRTYEGDDVDYYDARGAGSFPFEHLDNPDPNSQSETFNKITRGAWAEGPGVKKSYNKVSHFFPSLARVFPLPPSHLCVWTGACPTTRSRRYAYWLLESCY